MPHAAGVDDAAGLEAAGVANAAGFEAAGVASDMWGHQTSVSFYYFHLFASGANQPQIASPAISTRCCPIFSLPLVVAEFLVLVSLSRVPKLFIPIL